jgi:hypothetical protein
MNGGSLAEELGVTSAPHEYFASGSPRVWGLVQIPVRFPWETFWALSCPQLSLGAGAMRVRCPTARSVEKVYLTLGAKAPILTQTQATMHLLHVKAQQSAHPC